MEQNGLKVEYMPFGINDDFCRLDVEKKYDVSFVGQKHGVRGDVMNQLLKSGIKVHLFGHYWDGYPNWHGRPSPQDMNLIFNQTKVNLNFRWTSRNASRGIVNGRSFELLGAGAFMAATQHSETDEFNKLYIPDLEFVEAHYVNQLIDHILYYQDDDHASNREAMAEHAYQKREQHLWTARFHQFLGSELWKK